MKEQRQRTIGVIPARMGSSRFPGKPLAPIAGMPMIGHVYRRTCMNRTLAGVYVATCDSEIADYIMSIGGTAIMTSPDHERCTDRAAEAVLHIEERRGGKVDAVVLVQGDEPLVTPGMIESAVNGLLQDPAAFAVNLAGPILTDDELQDPNEIKVVTDLNGYALLFSRSPIPYGATGKERTPAWKQICVIPFRRDALLRFSSLPPTPLEMTESIDMMRLVEHGYKVRMTKTRQQVHSVDTPADRELVEALMQKDPLVKIYSEHGNQRMMGAA